MELWTGLAALGESLAGDREALPGWALRLLLPAVPAAAVAWWVERASAARGLLPTGALPTGTLPTGTLPTWDRPAAERGSIEGSGTRSVEGIALRRAAAVTLLALVLYLGVTAPLAFRDAVADLAGAPLAWPDLFAVHALFLVALAGWFGLLFGAAGGRELLRQCRLWVRRGAGAWSRAKLLGREVALGLAWGAVAWMVSIGLTVGATFALGLASEPDAEALPPMVVALAALPWLLRLAVSISAGVVEELFFRGFLQGRLGIAASGALFVLPHLAYQEPPMLIGVAALSLIFAFLVRARGNLWAAITAHATFDAIQLLVVVPAVLDAVETTSTAL